LNTIGKAIKEFRNFLRDRARKKIITSVDMDGWKVLEEEIDAIYLSNDEIETIKNTDLSHHRVMSHTCRRSFCTNEFLAETPVELIMKISGHKSVKYFYKYIRITPEEAGRETQQLWNEREMNIAK
jgi:hypothetical protein